MELISEAMGECSTEVEGADGVRLGGRGSSTSVSVQGVSVDDKARPPVDVVLVIDDEDMVGNAMDVGEEGVMDAANSDDSAALGLGNNGSAVDKGIEGLLDENR